MKKLFLLSACLIAIAGCSSIPSNDQSKIDESLSSDVNKNVDEFYLDSYSIRVNNYTMSNIKTTCNKDGDEYQLELAFKLTNNSATDKNFKLKGCSIYREDDNKICPYIKVDGIPNLPEPNLGELYIYPTTINITAKGKIPSDINVYKYYLKVTTNNRVVMVHLYNTPDDKKETWTITYRVASKVVATVEVKDNECVPAYRYDSEDHQMYSNDWYEDNSLSKPFLGTTPIRGNKTLYGKYFYHLKYNLNTTPNYATIEQITSIPYDRVLVIPNKYNNRDINIGENAITGAWSIEKIYIPKEVHAIYGGNFNLKSAPTIYYSGNEEEWKSSFLHPADIVTQNVVYNVVSPY